MSGSIRGVRGDWEIEDFDIKRYPLTLSIPKFSDDDVHPCIIFSDGKMSGEWVPR